MLVEVSSPAIKVRKQYSSIQKNVLYRVKNGSEKHLSKVAHTIELYSKNELVEVKDEWGQIKLAPGESKAYSYTVQDNELVFDTVKITIYEIFIIKVGK